MFYVSIIFQNVQLVVTWGGGGGDPKKILDIVGGGGDSKRKWKFSNFHLSPPLINNERSLNI